MLGSRASLHSLLMVQIMTPLERRRKMIQVSIAECDRFITKEEARAADLRPDSVAFLLDRYKAHRLKLVTMLDDNSNPVADATKKDSK